jgi:hypothetical protein
MQPVAHAAHKAISIAFPVAAVSLYVMPPFKLTLDLALSFFDIGIRHESFMPASHWNLHLMWLLPAPSL